MFLSHPNYDHFSAAGEVASAYDVRELLIGPEFRDGCRDKSPAEARLATLDAVDRPPRIVSPGDRIPLGRDTCG